MGLVLGQILPFFLAFAFLILHGNAFISVSVLLLHNDSKNPNKFVEREEVKHQDIQK